MTGHAKSIKKPWKQKTKGMLAGSKSIHSVVEMSRCHVLSPFCPREDLLYWIIQKSDSAFSLLSEDFLRTHLAPYFGRPLKCGVWESPDAEISNDQKTVKAAPSGCGTAKISWSLPICLDGASWHFAVQMKPLGVLCVDHLLEYDAAAAVLRRRSANGGWGAPRDLQPPVSKKPGFAYFFFEISIKFMNIFNKHILAFLRGLLGICLFFSRLLKQILGRDDVPRAL